MVPPVGQVTAYEPDTERRGVDGRRWRAVEIYEGKGRERKTVCAAWMPLTEAGKLIPPPPGVSEMLDGGDTEQETEQFIARCTMHIDINESC